MSRVIIIARSMKYHNIKTIRIYFKFNVIDHHIKKFGRCAPCFKSKKSTKYCRIIQSHYGEQAAPCCSCFEQSLSVTHCHLKLGHHGPGVYWITRRLDKKKVVPQCYFDLKSVSFTNHNTNIKSDTTATISHLGPQCPQDYDEGFLLNYTVKKWEEWRKSFENQTGTVLKLCTDSNANKEANCGVVQKEGDVLSYTVCWRQQYTCFRGGQPQPHEMLQGQD